MSKNDISKDVGLCSKTIEKIINYLNIKPRKIEHKNQYSTKCYNKQDVKLIKLFLKEHPDTRRFFCSVNNGMHNKDVVNKVVNSRKNRSINDKQRSYRKFKKTYTENNCADKIRTKRLEKIERECPDNYISINELRKLYKGINGTSYIRSICNALSIDIVNINNNLYISINDYDIIKKYIRKHYGKPGRYLGESLTAWFLDKHNISYEFQKYFNDCRCKETNRILPFDFYLTDYNCCIEIDGPEHKNNDIRKNRDRIKNRYCKKNNIRLIRIKWGYDKYYNKEYLFNKLESELI